MRTAGSGKDRKSQINFFIILWNGVLFLALAAAFFVYDSDFKQKLYDQNLEDISNINQASANIAASFFSGQEIKLRDMALYMQARNMSYYEAMAYISVSNSDTTRSVEIIGQDFKGFRIGRDRFGTYSKLDYSQGYGTFATLLEKGLQESDNQRVKFAPEFTDGYTAMKSFGLYNCQHLVGEGGHLDPYIIMMVSRTSDFIDRINLDSGYEELSTALINESGDYIIGSQEFKSGNFFKYLADFNNLSLDQQKALHLETLKNARGTLNFLDGRGKKCVFVFSPVEGKSWYCITAVPEDCFHNGGIELSFAAVAVGIMLLLLVTDLWYLAGLNRRLKVSAENERIASAAKSDFLSRMSHDMRTPMNGIIGMTRLTEDIPGLPKEARDNLSAISESSAYLLQLINDTLDMNKIESRKITLNSEVIHAGELVEHVISTVKPLMDQKKINLKLISVHAELDYIRGDRVRLQQIFLNILSNAVKFTPEQGTITIEVECLKRENGVANDRISITDTGCGMSEEFLKHIFEPFSQEQTKIVRGQEGTGLGMSIVKNLVELMGGRIEIESKLGQGTRVTVFLNFERVYDVKDQRLEEAPEERDRKLKGKRVLLAEDHPLNATIARRLLEKKGMEVEHAENGEIALSMFAASAKAYYDVVLMDIRMPVMDGLAAAKGIRALDREDAKTTPILAMTANAYVEDVQAAKAAGMNAHLAKPIEPELMYTEIAKYL